jgi:hypothetical protein
MISAVAISEKPPIARSLPKIPGQPADNSNLRFQKLTGPPRKLFCVSMCL